MVSNAALAAVCVWSGLHQHLVFESASLAHDVREYASLLQRNQVQEFALAEKEGRLIGQYWHNIETPKVEESELPSYNSAHSDKTCRSYRISLSPSLGRFMSPTIIHRRERRRFSKKSSSLFTATSRFRQYHTIQQKFCLSSSKPRVAKTSR